MPSLSMCSKRSDALGNSGLAAAVYPKLPFALKNSLTIFLFTSDNHLGHPLSIDKIYDGGHSHERYALPIVGGLLSGIVFPIFIGIIVIALRFFYPF